MSVLQFQQLFTRHTKYFEFIRMSAYLSSAQLHS